MNRRSLTVFVLLGMAAILRAQDKAATPKAAKSADQPKVLTFQPVPGAAALDPLSDGPAQIVADFFAALRDGKIDEGYAALTKDSKIAEKPEELKTLKAKTREAIEVFGNISGYDLVESRAVGQRLVRATYTSLGKVFPLRWRFYFYKPESAWRLIDMRVDDKLTGIFDEIEPSKPADEKASDGPQP